MLDATVIIIRRICGALSRSYGGQKKCLTLSRWALEKSRKGRIPPEFCRNILRQVWEWSLAVSSKG